MWFQIQDALLDIGQNQVKNIYPVNSKASRNEKKLRGIPPSSLEMVANPALNNSQNPHDRKSGAEGIRPSRREIWTKKRDEKNLKCLNSSALAFDGTLAVPSPAPSAAARGAQPTSPARLPFHLLPWKNLRHLPLAGLRLPLLEKNTNAIYSRGEVEKQKRFLDESRVRTDFSRAICGLWAVGCGLWAADFGLISKGKMMARTKSRHINRRSMRSTDGLKFCRRLQNSKKRNYKRDFHTDCKTLQRSK